MPLETVKSDTKSMLEGPEHPRYTTTVSPQ